MYFLSERWACFNIHLEFDSRRARDDFDPAKYFNLLKATIVERRSDIKTASAAHSEPIYKHTWPKIQLFNYSVLVTLHYLFLHSIQPLQKEYGSYGGGSECTLANCLLSLRHKTLGVPQTLTAHRRCTFWSTASNLHILRWKKYMILKPSRISVVNGRQNKLFLRV
jgi:hypothetical protein